MGVRVFISYRRSDNRHLAGRLQDRLTDAFGDENVFYDVESIGFGHDFREVIRSTLQSVDVVVAVVGPGFSPDRLASPHDVVRMELAMAFSLAIPVIPVLVDNAEMPDPSALPPDLERFSYLHAAPLRPDPDFRPDATRLITAIRSLAESRRTTPTPAGSAAEPAKRALVDEPGPGISVLAFSRDGQLAAGDAEGAVRVWQPDTGRQLEAITTTGPPWDMAFSPHDRALAIVVSGVVLLFGPDTDRRLFWHMPRTEPVRAIAFSPDGRLLACGGIDGRIRIWNVPDRRREHEPAAHTGAVVAVAFSPDGRRLASASEGAETSIRIWDVDTGAFLGPLVGHDRQVACVTYSPAGGRLASASTDGTVRLWDPDERRLVRSITASRQPVRRVAYSPDGRLLATSATSTAVRLWDADSGELVAMLDRHSVGVRDIAFSPDGSVLATCGGARHGQARSELFLWDLT